MKVNLKIEHKSADDYICFNAKGILNEKGNILIYSEQNNTKVKFNLDKSSLIRENDEMIIELHFINDKITPAKIYFKNLQQETVLNLKTLKIIKDINIYKFVYQIEEESPIEYQIQLIK